MTKLQKAKERVEKAAMRWSASYEVGLDLHRMKVPAYLCGASPSSAHALFKSCAALAAAQRKGRK